MHLTAPAPLASSLNPSVPFALDAVLLRAMAKDPSQRFADAGEFRNALQEVLASLNTVTESVPSIPETTVPLEEEAQKEGGKKRVAESHAIGNRVGRWVGHRVDYRFWRDLLFAGRDEAERRSSSLMSQA
jgi:serine/threonine-protein kinase